jgi:hypothetical protein
MPLVLVARPPLEFRLDSNTISPPASMRLASVSARFWATTPRLVMSPPAMMVARLGRTSELASR